MHSPSPFWRQGRFDRLLVTLIVPSLLCLVISTGSGCSKEEFNDLVDKTKEAVSETKDKVEKQVLETGNISLLMSPPIEFDRAIVEVISVGDGRPSVIQITTYDPASGPKAGASLMLHGTTTATSADALANQTVPCSLFLQPASGLMARSPEGTSVTVSFTTVDREAGTISGTIGGATLEAADGKTPMSITSGTIKAVISGGN